MQTRAAPSINSVKLCKYFKPINSSLPVRLKAHMNLNLAEVNMASSIGYLDFILEQLFRSVYKELHADRETGC